MTIRELLEKAKNCLLGRGPGEGGPSLPEVECYFSSLGRDRHALEEETHLPPPVSLSPGLSPPHLEWWATLGY